MLKVLSLFSGYGTDNFALKMLGIKHIVIAYSDIDKYANKCFQQNHGGKELGDATKINPNDLEDFDLLTGGFPCQAFSVAGKGLGELDTRGTLFNEIIRIAEVKKPNYMLLENVKGLISKKHQPTFQKILSELERIGYHVHWKVLNTKDYGIPQNRERVFFVCFRDYFEWKKFKFPEKEELKIFLKNILEPFDIPQEWRDNLAEYEKHHRDEVYDDDQTYGEMADSERAQIEMREEEYKKYYLSKERVGKLLTDSRITKKECFISSLQAHNTIREDGLANCLPSAMGMGGGHTLMIKQTIPVLTPDRLNKRQNGRRFKTDGEPMFTLNTQDRHGILQIGMIEQKCTKRTYETPKKINEFLRTYKLPLTLQQIADYLNLPKTQVEHYFRTDQSRAIPSPENWTKLKELLKFDDTYDKQVTDIYEKEVEFESTRRVYSDQGCSPCISSANADKIIQINDPKHSQQRVYNPEGISPTIAAGNNGGGKEPCKIIQLNNPKHSNDRVYDKDGISPTLNTMQGGDRQPFIKIKNATTKGYLEAREGDGVNLEQPNSKTRRGRVQLKSSPTLQCNDARGVVLEDLTIRKLTPRECFRLQGFLNDEVNLQGLSNTQQYKLAGNGQSVNVVAKIFERMFT